MIDFSNSIKNVYTSKSNTDHIAMQDFLNKCNLPQLDKNEAAQLNSEISVDEVIKAFSALKSNKAPGPDGLPGELYKKI